MLSSVHGIPWLRGEIRKGLKQKALGKGLPEPSEEELRLHLGQLRALEAEAQQSRAEQLLQELQEDPQHVARMLWPFMVHMTLYVWLIYVSI